MKPEISSDAPIQTIRCRYAIIGSGIAGLWTALHLPQQDSIAVITKSTVRESSTEYAQGGIAVALPPSDSPELHKQDTLQAGAGLGDEPAVEILTREGPQVVEELISYGAVFDLEDGHLAYGREAAHGINRIVHAHGDATGEEVERTAYEAVRKAPNITIYQETAAAELLVVDGECVGVEAVAVPSGEVTRFIADVTLVATGGVGSLYKYSTNPPVATADGIALAYRAGAALQDLEFIQFHPTALADEGYPKFLISESVRGEGAKLLNANGEQFMSGYHPRAEMAPRDVVARAVYSEILKAANSQVYLDFRPLGTQRMGERFPGILNELHQRGFTPEQQPVPITPVAHYMMGGIATDLHGQTDIGRLFACGECASYGVHGANRLASNSLLDGLVFGKRSAAAMAKIQPLSETLQEQAAACEQNHMLAAPADLKPQIQQLMWKQVGIIRNGDELARAQAQLAEWADQISASTSPALAELEAANMCQAGMLMAAAALHRTESRGAHYRTDFPDINGTWRKHVIVHRSPAGDLAVSDRPVDASTTD